MISDIAISWHISDITTLYGCLRNRSLIKVFYCQMYPCCFLQHLTSEWEKLEDIILDCYISPKMISSRVLIMQAIFA